MTGRLVDISFSLNRKQRITLEVDSDFRNLSAAEPCLAG